MTSPSRGNPRYLHPCIVVRTPPAFPEGRGSNVAISAQWPICRGQRYRWASRHARARARSASSGGVTTRACGPSRSSSFSSQAVPPAVRWTRTHPSARISCDSSGYDSATQAENSARDAAASARTAQQAAASAQASAQRASNLAVRAQQDAQSAAASATEAYDAAMSAYNSAIAANKDKDAAIQAYNDARADALAKGNAEKAKREQDWIAACKDKNPDTNGQLYKDCVLLGTGTPADQAYVEYRRGLACTIFNIEGSPAYHECVEPHNLLSPDFSASPELLHALEKIAVVVISVSIGLTFATGLTVLSLAAPFLATALAGLFLSTVPDGALFLPLILPAAGLLGGVEVSGVLTEEALTANLEQAMVENELADAELAQAASEAADAAPTGTLPCIRNSFLGGTNVVLADRTTKPIDRIAVGDLVLATDPVAGTTAARPVTHLITGSGVKHVVALTLAPTGGPGAGQPVIETTDGHPFWVVGPRKWTDADHVKIGDSLLAADGRTVSVVKIDRRDEDTSVYNLTVDGLHTYYVQADGTSVLTHNGEPGCDLYPNNMPGDLDLELAVAERLGVKPTTVGTPAFDEAINAGRIKWAVLEDGSLVIEPKHIGEDEISHAVLSGPFWKFFGGGSGCQAGLSR